ncbi:MAG TPA: LysR family transcriptional regulator [Candidatus Micrarchaeia archaeon]|nr:LysR family transcriptional regulator [Candidatus Micrarchaeia archaeon]
MELRVLRYLVAVAEAGSVTQAARAVNVAQPSLSRQLHQLERELGLELFRRTRGRLQLSAAGRQLLIPVQELLTRADHVRWTATELRTGLVPHLDLVGPAVAINDIVAPYLATLGASRPLLRVVDEPPERLPTALARGADLLVAATPPIADVNVVLLARLPIFAYVPAGHPWAGRARVSLVELTGETLLLPTREHTTRRLLDSALQQLGLTYGRVTDCRLPQVAQALAATGHGVAVVSDDPRFGLLSLVVEGVDGPIRLPLFAAWERGHYADRAIRTIVRELAQFCVDRYGEGVRGDGVGALQPQDPHHLPVG